MKKVMVLGGYGNFGKRIVRALVAKKIPVIIVGRNKIKAEALARQLGDLAQVACFDVRKSLAQNLREITPTVVINTCGPFQTSDYQVAKDCIDQQANYIDLADGRKFVGQIVQLNNAAEKAGVSIISGASTVPGLSSAVVEHFRQEFSEIDTMIYGISPGQGAERGLATTRGIMSYVGKQLAPFPGIKAKVFGWQSIYRQHYPELGKRWMANCDIPDLDLLPARYGIKKIQFSAGLELSALHLGLWAISGLVRLGLPLQLARFSRPLLWASDLFNGLGTSDGGMHVILSGKSKDGTSLVRKWFIIAKNGDGPHIPTIPAIVLAEKIINQGVEKTGAYPCVGQVCLAEYLKELQAYAVTTHEF